jgi:hypothetical protein
LSWYDDITKAYKHLKNHVFGLSSIVTGYKNDVSGAGSAPVIIYLMTGAEPATETSIFI